MPNFKRVRKKDLKQLGKKLGIRDVNAFLRRKERMIKNMVGLGKTEMEDQMRENMKFRT